jgi:hypothetical protein
MKGTLTFTMNTPSGPVMHHFTVEVVEPIGHLYTPVNAVAVEKQLEDSRRLKLPIPLGVQVIERTMSA